jgi:hypothetical protein
MKVNHNSLGTIGYSNLVKRHNIRNWSIPTDDDNIDETYFTDKGTKNLSNEFLDYMKASGITHNAKTKAYYVDNNEHSQLYPDPRKDLIDINFDDLFYKNLKFEINLTWKLGFLRVL